MSRATCEECGHSWTTRKSPDEFEDGPRCSECGSTAVEVADDEGPADPHAGPGFDPDVATGSGRDDDAEELREALLATPGVGSQAADYCVFWFQKSVESPEDLHDILTDVDSVDSQIARRIVETIYSESDAEDAEVPAYSGESSRESPATPAGSGGSGDTLDAIIRAKQAGLLGGGDDDGTDAEAVAEAVSEAMSPALRQMSQTQQMLAEAMQDDGGEQSEVEQLREELEEMREERRQDEIERLESELEEIKEQAGQESEEIVKLKETRRSLENAPEVSARAAREWEDVIHSALSRLKDYERQRAMMGDPTGGPTYEPPRAGQQGQQSGPGQQAPAPRQAATDGRQRQRTHETPQNRGEKPSQSENNDTKEQHDNTQQEDHDMSERQPQGVSEEDAQEVRQKLGLSASEDDENEEVGA